MRGKTTCALSMAVWLASSACTDPEETCEHPSDGGAGGSSASGGSAGGGEGGGGGGGTVKPDCEVVLDDDVVVDTTYDASCVLRVEGEITVQQDATLTLTPGLWVEMGPSASIWVGNFGDGSPGRILAEGTEDEPILFTSDSDVPAPGDWGAIVITNGAKAGTKFEHVIFEYGGAFYTYLDNPAPISIYLPEYGNGGRLSIDSCTFRNNAHAGVSSTAGISDPLPDWFTSFDHNTFENNGEHSMALRANMVSSVGANNTVDQPILIWSSVLNDDEPWPNLGVPYVIAADLQINGTTAVITWDDLTIQMGMGGALAITRGKLFARNTVFESASKAPSPGDWGAIFVDYEGQIVLDGARISHGDGTTYAVLWMQPPAAAASTIVGTVFSDNIGPADIKTSSEGCAKFTSAQPPNEFDLVPCVN